MTGAAVHTDGLGKRYGSTWALRDCTLDIPAGSVAALVGPNGAGKTTLLQLAIGLSGPTAGSVEVLGCNPRADAGTLLPRVGFVAQDHPLHRGFSVAETLKLGRRLNPTWDEEAARARLARLGIPLERKVGKLSGGQQAQVALTLALAKRPELLLLDEPVASLDPLARREFMNTVMEVVSDTDLTVVLSSHIVADLERVCDHLVILSHARTLLAAPIDEVLAGHRLVVGPRGDAATIARRNDVIRESHTERQTSLLVRADRHVYDAGWEVHEVDLEEIVLAYLGYGASASPLVQLEAVGQ
jgi:ABC-2 type transport system ATP-binding protein